MYGASGTEVFAFAVAATGAAQAPAYTFTPIAYPSATAGTTVARGINDAGQIAGFFRMEQARTTALSAMQMGLSANRSVDYPSATATSTSPRSINSAGGKFGSWLKGGRILQR